MHSRRSGDEESSFESGALGPEDLAPLLGTSALGWTDEETGLIVDLQASESLGGYVADDELRREIAERLWPAHPVKRRIRQRQRQPQPY